MFISEVEEAEYCGFENVTEGEMVELNKVKMTNNPPPNNFTRIFGFKNA